MRGLAWPVRAWRGVGAGAMITLHVVLALAIAGDTR
jgi:hypothetical protein